MTRYVDGFDEVRKRFEACIGDIVYATMTTVDRRGRPRARVLIPVWEVVDDRPLGWLATYRTPVKAARLAGNPHATFSHWTPRQNFVATDTVAHWVDDEGTRRHVWELCRITSPPGAGYDLGRFWRDPDDPTLHVPPSRRAGGGRLPSGSAQVGLDRHPRDERSLHDHRVVAAFGGQLGHPAL